MSFSGKNTVIFISCSFALLRSKQLEFLKQEIYSRLILYNFGIFIANEAAEENRKKKRDTPYAQIIDSILIYGNFSSGLLDKSFL